MKLKKLIPIILSTFYFLLSTFYFLFSTSAPARAENMHLAISPPLLEVTIKPGKTITQVYNIKNKGDTIQLYSQIIPFYPKGEKGKTQLDQAFLNPFTNPRKTGKYAFLNWFSLQNAGLELGNSFTIKEGGKQQLVLKIRVPEDAEKKDYWAALALRNIPTINLEREQISASGIITSNIILTTSNQADWQKKGSAEINLQNKPCFPKTNICLPVIDSFTRPRFKLKVHNQGKHFFKPQGKLIIKNLFGKEVDSLKILPTNVLAGTKRQLECQKNKEITDCQTKSLKLGLYRADLNLDLHPHKKFLLQFFVLPYKLGIGIVVGVILFIYLKRVSALDNNNNNNT